MTRTNGDPERARLRSGVDGPVALMMDLAVERYVVVRSRLVGASFTVNVKSGLMAKVLLWRTFVLMYMDCSYTTTLVIAC